VTNETVQIVAGLLCILCVAIIVVRRKGNKKKIEDEF